MADKYVTVAGAGTKAGTSWGDAFDSAAWLTDMSTLAAAGDTYWVAGGTYAYTAPSEVARDGSALAKINVIGVNSGTTNEPPVVSDYAYGTNRPLITNNNAYHFDNYWSFLNLRIDLTTSFSFRMDIEGSISNCYVRNQGSGSAILTNGDGCIVFNNEIISASSNGIITNSGDGAHILNNYIHDSSTGIYSTIEGCIMEGNIIDTCSTGISIGSYINQSIINNTLYNGNTGISGSTSNGNLIFNNIIDSFINGINFTSTSKHTFIDYNNYYNNTTDVTGITKGPNAIAVDPQFTDAANGDFSLASAAALIGAGFGIRLGVS